MHGLCPIFQNEWHTYGGGSMEAWSNALMRKGTRKQFSRR